MFRLQTVREAVANLLPRPVHCKQKFQDFSHYALPEFPVFEEKAGSV